MKIRMLILTLLLNTAPLFAQFSINTEFGYMYDNNLDNNAYQITDQITASSMALNYLFGNDRQEANIFYSYNFNYYSKNIARTFHLHSLGAEYYQSLDKKERTTLNAYLSIDKRIGRSEFVVYDYLLFSANTSLKHLFKETMQGQISYNFSLMNFSDLKDFNYSEHMLSAKYSHQLFDRTTLIFNINLSGKFYTNPSDTSSNPASSRSSVIQSISSIRLGQGIVEGTGVSLLAQYQFNLQKETRYLSANYGAMSDDELFDDHYGFEGLLLQGMLTQVLPFDAKARFIFTTQERLYSNLPAYNWLGYIIANQRKDTRTAYTINFTKSFESLGIELNLTYDYIINKSNDSLYDYTNNALNLLISIAF